MNKKLEILLIILIVFDGAMLLLKNQFNLYKGLKLGLYSIEIALLLFFIVVLVFGKKKKKKIKNLKQEEKSDEEEKLE